MFWLYGLSVRLYCKIHFVCCICLQEKHFGHLVKKQWIICQFSALTLIFMIAVIRNLERFLQNMIEILSAEVYFQRVAKKLICQIVFNIGERDGVRANQGSRENIYLFFCVLPNLFILYLWIGATRKDINPLE